MHLAHPLTGIILVMAFGVSGGVLAQPVGELLSGDEIRAQVWGKQVKGAMTDGLAYSEAYTPEGDIIGDGYIGRASIQDDTMCLDYGGDEPTCYGVRLDGDGGIEWLAEGEVAGYGEITEIP